MTAQEIRELVENQLKTRFFTDEGIQDLVEKTVKNRLKVIEIETAGSILSRLAQWAKWVGGVAGFLFGILALILVILGYGTYKDFQNAVTDFKDQATLAKYASMKAKVDARDAQRDALKLEALIANETESMTQKKVSFEQNAQQASVLLEQLRKLLEKFQSEPKTKAAKELFEELEREGQGPGHAKQILDLLERVLKLEQRSLVAYGDRIGLQLAGHDFYVGVESGNGPLNTGIFGGPRRQIGRDETFVVQKAPH